MKPTCNKFYTNRNNYINFFRENKEFGHVGSRVGCAGRLWVRVTK